MADDGSRPSSPTSWASPSLALSACPRLDRSVSTASSVSSISGRSTMSDGNRGRGYMRPQGTDFSESAKNRDSVMCLGSIAHLQYYFARTGLLDGKGGQLMRAQKSGAAGSSDDSLDSSEEMLSLGIITNSEKDDSFMDDSYLPGLVDSPVEHDDFSSGWGDNEPIMLPPTVSTYNYRTPYVPPPPDLNVLRRELREAIDDATKVLDEIAQFDAQRNANNVEDDSSEDLEADLLNQPFYEIQGLNILDVITLAIRAAKNYYTAHEDPEKLYSLKTQKDIRDELYSVLDILKTMAGRNFAGGIKKAEFSDIKSWTSGINSLLETEESKEKAEHEEREKWSWRDGDWTGRERERELHFLRSFDTNATPLPDWTEPSADQTTPTPFLEALQSGLRLVHLHNESVHKSRRQFEVIRVFHTDLAKPYRRADNLRYWVKAAELRWEVKLDIDVMGVVLGNGPECWKKFDDALLKWCKAVREEITLEWKQQKTAAEVKTPTFRVDEDFHHGIFDAE